MKNIIIGIVIIQIFFVFMMFDVFENRDEQKSDMINTFKSKEALECKGTYKNILICNKSIIQYDFDNKGLKIKQNIPKDEVRKIEFKEFVYKTNPFFGSARNVTSNYLNIYNINEKIVIKKEIDNTSKIDSLINSIKDYGYQINRDFL